MGTSLTLDFGTSGIKEGAVKAGKIIGWHIATDAIIIITAEVAHILGKAQITHPEYSIYFMGVLAASNAVLGFLGRWLSDHAIAGDTLNPQPLPPGITDTGAQLA